MKVGIAAVAVVGMFFILFVDLYLKGDSVELFIGIILSLASIVLFILAESFKHRPWMFYLFKGLAIAFAVGFVVYAFIFRNNPTYTDTKTVLKLIKTVGDDKVFFLNSAKFNDGIDIPFDKGPIYIVMLVVSIIGCVGEAINTAFNAVIGLD